MMMTCYLSETLLRLLPGGSGPMSMSSSTTMAGGGEGTMAVAGGGKVCTHPANYFSWDGIHLTDAMHRALVSRFLYTSLRGDPFAEPHPNFLTPCV